MLKAHFKIEMGFLFGLILKGFSNNYVKSKKIRWEKI